MDIESKKFLGQPKNFVSIFNALLFDGQLVLKPEYLKDENSELVMNVSSKHVDIIKRYEDGTYLDLFVIESQSNVDPSMVARVMEYESVARMRYIRQNFKKHVPMILTVVLYVGESKWNAAKRLSELEIIHPGFEDTFNEFKLNLIELNTNHKYNTGEKATQDFFDLLRIIYRKQILKEDLDREFNRDALYFAYVVTKNKELLNIYQKSKKRDVKVCRALDEMFEESTNRGIQMGIKQGIEQGIERGVKNTQIKIAIKMLVRNNQTIEEISEIVGLDLNALRELKKSI
ncbi:MAG: Rpn family recombination-promoting nuclease/putative transposase [Holdemanella sp.]